MNTTFLDLQRLLMFHLINDLILVQTLPLFSVCVCFFSLSLSWSGESLIERTNQAHLYILAQVFFSQIYIYIMMMVGGEDEGMRMRDSGIVGKNPQ